MDTTLGQAHKALKGKNVLISRQASEHLNLDYRVKFKIYYNEITTI